MWQVIKSLLLTPDRASDALETGAKAIDAVVNTKEERATFMFEWVQMMGPTNVARRLIAFVVTGVWAIYQLLMLVLLVSNFWWDTKGVRSEIIIHMDRTITYSFLLVAAFYFAPHMIAAYKGNIGKMMEVLRDSSSSSR